MLAAGTAQWVAYAYAVQSSPDKERFGKGAVEGVLGPGAANNSTRGGDLITTVAFGIPSSVSTAILFGAFLIQGIVPGPDMLNPAKHLTLTFSFVWIIIVSNIITVAVCFLFLKQLAKITNIRGSLLIPFLLLLIYLGGFTVKNSFGDMIMVLIFGALGWLMVQFDWQRPPLLVGLVLGTITERNFWISTRAYGFDWLLHPGVLIIAVFIIGAIVYSIRQILQEKRNPPSTVAEAAPEPDTAMLTSPVYRPIFALFFVGLFIYVLREVYFEIRPMEERAALFPDGSRHSLPGFGALGFWPGTFQCSATQDRLSKSRRNCVFSRTRRCAPSRLLHRRLDLRFFSCHLALGLSNRRAGCMFSLFSLRGRREMADIAFS